MILYEKIILFLYVFLAVGEKYHIQLFKCKSRFSYQNIAQKVRCDLYMKCIECNTKFFLGVPCYRVSNRFPHTLRYAFFAIAFLMIDHFGYPLFTRVTLRCIICTTSLCRHECVCMLQRTTEKQNLLNAYSQPIFSKMNSTDKGTRELARLEDLDQAL